MQSHKVNIGKDWNRKWALGLHLINDYPELNSYEISEGNIKCEECKRKLLNYMTNNPGI